MIHLVRAKHRTPRDELAVAGDGNGQRGQSLIEFTLLLPVMMLFLVSLLEFGLAFNHQLTLVYASREGARTGSALANGGGPLGCTSPGSPNWSNVDPAIVTAVERILESPGSPIVRANIGDLRIYKADAAGNQIGTNVNVWTYNPGTGSFTQGSVGWQACNRTYANPADSIGVQVNYRYDLITPLGSLLRYLGGTYAASFTLNDRTIMQVNPVN